MDILVQTVRNEGVFALYKGRDRALVDRCRLTVRPTGMASPLVGIAAVNSLLFAAYNVSKRVVTPFPDTTLPQVALAGSMAGAINSVLASPGASYHHHMWNKLPPEN